MFSFIVAASVVAVVWADQAPVPSDCSQLSQHINQRCYGFGRDISDLCNNDRAALVAGNQCALASIAHCNPAAVPYFPLASEVQASISATCAQSSSLVSSCMALYIHNTAQLAACMPTVLRDMTDPSESMQCKGIKAGIMCGLRDVRACDAHTADVLLNSNQMQIDRICAA